MNSFISEIYKYRFLIHELVVRDIKKKYRRSVLGILWSVLNPLLMMAVTAMVFSTIFRFSIANYPLYILIGQIMFTFFSESTNFAMTSIIENSTLLKKVYIPKYLFPLTRVMSSCINLFFSLPALIVIIIVTGQRLRLEMLTFIFPLFLLFIFCVGCGLILATMVVYFRDVYHLYGVFISLLSYATPIFYPENIVPARYSWLFKFNPLYYFSKAFRQPLYEGIAPDSSLLIPCLFISLFTLFIGYYVFEKHENNFILYA